MGKNKIWGEAQLDHKMHLWVEIQIFLIPYSSMAKISREKNKKYKTKGSQSEQWLIPLALNIIPFNPAIYEYFILFPPPP